MQSNINTGRTRELGIGETEIEKRGLKLNFDAPLTTVASIDDAVGAGFGDGSLTFFRPGLAPVTHKIHEGVILCMAKHKNGLISGGDDGRFLAIKQNGDITEIAVFGTKWVDCVAASDEIVACSSGSDVHLFEHGKSDGKVFKRLSTVGGFAFDKKGQRLAVAHYEGVTIWERSKRRWKSTRLFWKGSHGNVSFSPDGKYIVTTMQENSVHGWRLRDKGDLAMSGYPAKVKSLDWVGDTPFLATSGADEAICWPFDGKFGPMERSPVCVAHNRKKLATFVRGLPGEEAVFAGFQDGAVLLAKLDEEKKAIAIRGSTNAEVSGIAVSNCGSHILIGDIAGNVLWAPLWA